MSEDAYNFLIGYLRAHSDSSIPLDIPRAIEMAEAVRERRRFESSDEDALREKFSGQPWFDEAIARLDEPELGWSGR